MSVLISSVTANFANASFAYSAIGLDIRDYGSSNASKLLHITSNTDPRLTIFKDGGLRLKANSTESLVDANARLIRSNFDIFSVDGDLKVRPNWLEQSKDISSEINTHDTAYAEEYQYIRTTNGAVVLNLANGTSFRVESTSNSITSLTFVKPTDTHGPKSRAYSCFVMFSGINSINTIVWTNAGIVWLEGVPPPATNNTIQFISFYNGSNTGYPALDNIWFGTGG